MQKKMERKETDVNPLPHAPAGTIRQEENEIELETVRQEGKEWRKYCRGYRLSPGEITTFRPGIGLVVVKVGGK